MRPIAFLICCCACGWLLQAQLKQAQAGSSPQPVYVFISASVSDHINRAMSEERLRRSLASVENYRKSNPSLTATVYFSGAMSDMLAQNNPQDHLLDFVRGSIDRGVVRPGYDGSDEPTYSNRPMLDFSKAKDAEERWMVRMDSARELLTEGRDPITGAPRPGRSGGLKRMQEVFGPAAMIRGVVLQMPNVWGPINEVGSDSEIVNVLRQLSPSALLLGLSTSDLAHTSGSQFRPWANVFSKMMSPAADTPPEMFWQEDALRLSETSLMDARTFRAEDGAAKLKDLLASLDRSHIRVVHVEIGGQRIYVKPFVHPMPKIVLPLEWAYGHPDAPQFPEELRYTAAQIEENYARQDAALKYLADDFLPANPGSRFVGPADLQGMAKPGWGYDLPVEHLRESVTEVLRKWGDGPVPPAYLKVDDSYLSLADLFEALADALAQQSRSGALPASVHVGRVFGPILTAQPRTPAEGDVTAASVGQVCAGFVDALHDDVWNPRPRNAIPSPIAIDGLNLTPAQFLRLMAEALVAPAPETKLRIRSVDMFAGQVMTFYNRRARTDLGAPWTYKPAVVESAASR